MKHFAAAVLIIASSILANADSTKWKLNSAAGFKIEGRQYSGSKILKVIEVTENKAKVEETIYLGNQVKVCQYIVNTKNDKTVASQCSGQIPNYTHVDFYPADTAFYIGQKKTTLKLKVGTYQSTCKTYRIGPVTGQAFAVNCTSKEIPFWGEVATVVSDPSGDRDIMYTELIDL
tara:strand:- start:47 stop:571 length:525 start_codon:yes stop_codon:yes gene_type:complete